MPPDDPSCILEYIRYYLMRSGSELSAQALTNLSADGYDGCHRFLETI
jgi:hypothetical protein